MWRRWAARSRVGFETAWMLLQVKSQAYWPEWQCSTTARTAVSSSTSNQGRALRAWLDPGTEGGFLSPCICCALHGVVSRPLLSIGEAHQNLVFSARPDHAPIPGRVREHVQTEDSEKRPGETADIDIQPTLFCFEREIVRCWTLGKMGCISGARRRPRLAAEYFSKGVAVRIVCEVPSLSARS